MSRHVRHVPVVTRVQPALQMCLVYGQVDIADADLREAQFGRPGADIGGESVQRRSGQWGVQAGIIVACMRV